MSLSATQAKARIDNIFSRYAAAAGSSAGNPLSISLSTGKLYEAWVLSVALEKLRKIENYAVKLKNGNKVTLKSSGGPINRAYPYFELSRTGGPDLEVWTDVEFTTLGYAQGGFSANIGPGDFHELDIVAVPAGTVGRPSFDEVVLGVECKNTAFQKHMMRAALGVRRALSLLCAPQGTPFYAWPRDAVPAKPPSSLLVFSTDPAVSKYHSAGQFFGVDFIHEPM